MVSKLFSALIADQRLGSLSLRARGYGRTAFFLSS